MVAARPLDGGGVEAAIVDQGPGIAADDLPHAFDRGYLWSRYRGTREVGSGLGLAIVKALCDAMGVTIQAESGHGGGTAFRLTSPRPAPPPGHPPPGRVHRPQPAPTRPALTEGRRRGYEPVAGLASLSSSRWPSGSRKKRSAPPTRSRLAG